MNSAKKFRNYKKHMPLKHIETPRNPETNNPQTPAHQEAHDTGYFEMSEEKIEPTRNEILTRYNIPPQNCFIRPINNQEQRKIRAFSTLKHKKTGEMYYAEGNTSHAYLLNDIADNLQHADLPNRDYIIDHIDEFLENWEVTKGFIDPFMKSFENYPHIREGLMKNGHEVEANWFVSSRE